MDQGPVYVIPPMPKTGRTAKMAESDQEKHKESAAALLPSLTSGFMAKTILRNLSSIAIAEPNTCEATGHVRNAPVILASLGHSNQKALNSWCFPFSWPRRNSVHNSKTLNLLHRIVARPMTASQTATFRSKRTARSFLRDLWSTMNTTTARFTSSAAEPVAYRAKDDFMMTSYNVVKTGSVYWSIVHTLSARRHVGQNPSLTKSSALP